MSSKIPFLFLFKIKLPTYSCFLLLRNINNYYTRDRKLYKFKLRSRSNSYIKLNVYNLSVEIIDTKTIDYNKQNNLFKFAHNVTDDF